MVSADDPVVFGSRFRARLVGSMVLFCGDRALGEEFAQEALARAVERWDRVGEMASPEAWTYRTAFNLARSWFRRQSIERRAHQRLATAERAAVLPDTATAVAVRQAVAALPPRQRAVVIARFYAGLSVDEAAETLECAPGTVKALTHKAIDRLRSAGLAVDEEVPIDAAPE